METKTLAFNVNDIEKMKEFFPDFKTGRMSARELGIKLVEVLENQATSPTSSDLQEVQSAYKNLQADYQQLADNYKNLQEKLAEGTVTNPTSSENTNLQPDLQEKLQELQDELQDAYKDKQTLQENLQNLQADNQHLVELQEKTTSELQANYKSLQEDLRALKVKNKDLQAQLQEATNKEKPYAFTSFFKSMVETLTDRINELSGTAYTPTDVITQSLFATFYNSHSSIMYTYPISKEELLALAQPFYPELSTTQELFELMIHKVKEEDA